MGRRPNILLFITDQHRADHLGCYGNGIVRTPNIDALAARGKRYERFYVANPVCMPNRASLMTGRMPSGHGVYSNGTPLGEGSRTFVQRLREEGYHTALIGKSHLQTITGWEAPFKPDPSRYRTGEDGYPSEAELPTRRGPQYLNEDPRSWEDPEFRVRTPFYGFDHVDVVTGHADEVGGDYERWLKDQPGGWNDRRGRKHGKRDERISTPQAWLTQLPEELYPSAYIGQQTEAYLAARKLGDAPFFVQCSFPDPHHPFTPPGRYWDMFDPDSIPLPKGYRHGDMPLERHLYRQFAGGTAQRETQMPYAATEREIREAIALTYGMIAMIDDQIGRVLAALEESGEADNTVVIFTTDHGDYMGDRGLLLKGPHHLHGVLRVPFIWADPEDPTPETIDDLAQTIDIGPTILSRADVKMDYGVQGRVLGQDPAPDAVLIEDSRQRINLGFERFQGLRTLITRDHRLTIGVPDAGNELIDLTNDPHEHENLWGQPQRLKLQAELTEKLVAKMIAMQDPVPLAPFYA
ncbi:sulfatase family protein [Microbaculum marinisediminis]|uniref:Sulfatase-like hydrolase/transferase n=1 Tax=Microbaculum marinisediminis TaxID=2931392 RepID=A0AAW5R353_9HYPH|nr:sulfatase-like hydrolase/transferase [Microbaculum sp. A6E488]MCT8974642.1 sulfatase-like hydrolase/transferase [Microbaculum sp. A6E488]